MSSDLQITVALLAREVQRMAAQLSPWVTTDEMCQRYDCTPQTLTNMERRGDIPMRIKGKWNRVELMQWESNPALQQGHSQSG